jgi:prostaglandin-H2 D-isomerase / glutathione transferase
MSYRLWYFPIRGRGEQIRLMLHALGQTYEDVVIKRDRFIELKQEGPATLAFGSMPMLEDGELRLVQGAVILGYLARKHGIAPSDLQAAARADAIAAGAEDLRSKMFSLSGEGSDEKQAAFVSGDWQSRWLPAFEGLLKLNGETGFFVGKSLTHADIAVWDALDGVLSRVKGATLDGYPALAEFRARIAQLPPLQPYLQSRA